MTHIRTPVTIDDPANRIDFYATFLHSNRRVALPIQQHLALRLTDERFMTHIRTPVTIDDPANRIDFYATFLHSNRRVALPIQQHLAQHWPQAA